MSPFTFAFHLGDNICFSTSNVSRNRNLTPFFCFRSFGQRMSIGKGDRASIHALVFEEQQNTRTIIIAAYVVAK